MRLAAAFLVTLFIGAFILAGCGGAKHTIRTPKGSVTVTDEGEKRSITIDSKEGDVKAMASSEKRPVTEAELGVPLFAGATGEMTISYEGNESGKSKTMHLHLLTTSDAFDDVVAFYKSHLKDIKRQSVTRLPEGKIASFYLEDSGQQISIAINEDRENNVTQIHVIRAGGG